jgi:predicted Zn finger-like uncharacterized protein
LKISCPSCEAKYSIGDDKVQSRLAKIRCRKCGVDIVIDGRVQPPTVSVGESTAAAPEAMQQATAAATHSYTIDFGENDQRTMSLEEVVSAYNEGYVTPETYVWGDGMTDWTPLGQIAEIVDALNAASAPVAQAPAVASRTPSPTATKAAATSSRATGRGGADLFGSLAKAGGEEDMAQQAAHAEPLSPQGSTTGARNESSVLFSLSALTSSAKSAPNPSLSSGMSSSASSREDSGLIDLKALTAQASSDTSTSAGGTGVGGFGGAAPLAPLGGLGAPLGGLGAPLGGVAPMAMTPALADLSYPQKKNRMGLYIGGGIAVGAIALALVFALKPEPPPPPKVDATPVIVYKTREPEPIKETVAKPPPTGEASATTAAATPKPPAGGKWRGGSAKPKPTGGGQKESGSGASTPPPPPKPAGNKCGCAPGDLACNMRCAAKG